MALLTLQSFSSKAIWQHSYGSCKQIFGTRYLMK